uniref:Uncharacterized protein n=1 Tax=Anguilla anguilla TaxID=7936 RepID=A0A0E9W5N1_ANGAN
MVELLPLMGSELQSWSVNHVCCSFRSQWQTSVWYPRSTMLRGETC